MDGRGGGDRTQRRRNVPQVCKEGEITIQPYKYCSEFLADRWPTSDVPSEANAKEPMRKRKGEANETREM